MDPSPQSPSSEQLLADARWLRRFACRLVHDPDAAEDLAQTAWLKALERRPDTTVPGGLRAWLARVTRNLAIRRWRDQGVRATHAQPMAEHASADAEPELARLELQQHLAAAILALPEPHRTAIVLRHLRELSHEEIGRQLSITEAAARKRVSRGIALLRERLTEEFGSESEWRDRFAVFLVRVPPRTDISRVPWAIGATTVILAAVWFGVRVGAPMSDRPVLSQSGSPSAAVRAALDRLSLFHGRWDPSIGGAGESIELAWSAPGLSAIVREYTGGALVSEGRIGWHPREERFVFLQFNRTLPEFEAMRTGHLLAGETQLAREYTVFASGGASTRYRDTLGADAQATWTWRLDCESESGTWTRLADMPVVRRDESPAGKHAAPIRHPLQDPLEHLEGPRHTRADDDALRAFEPFLGEWTFDEEPRTTLELAWALPQKALRVRRLREERGARATSSDGIIGWHFGEARVVSLEFAAGRVTSGNWSVGDDGSLLFESTSVTATESLRHRERYRRDGTSLHAVRESAREGGGWEPPRIARAQRAR